MMRPILTTLGMLLLCSCAMQREVSTLRQDNENQAKRIGDLETMLNDTDKDGIPDYLDAEPNTLPGMKVDSHGRAIDQNNNGVDDDLEKYLYDHERPLEMATAKPGYFEQLRPSAQYYNDTFLKPGSTLAQCNAKIARVLRNNMKLATGDFQYFALDNDGFGIVTKKQCIIADTGLPLPNCPNGNNCRWFDFFCVEQGYSQYYIILVSKSSSNGTIGFSEKEFDEKASHAAVKWQQVPELKALFGDSSKKLTDEYVFTVKLVEIHKPQMAGEASIVKASYEFTPKIKKLFH